MQKAILQRPQRKQRRVSGAHALDVLNEQVDQLQLSALELRDHLLDRLSVLVDRRPNLDDLRTAAELPTEIWRYAGEKRYSPARSPRCVRTSPRER